ncbi:MULTISPECIES: DMT family transporter [unclassified Paenibacillus]|uniref:DMT family transporter n=1 Tax=unclassified Paenibacillus TaxID=185978 RepID=UPI001AE330B4|nr:MULTISPECIES: DMT family transporter [unclassified Paenibacillus]MBP1153323.1 drug/metabolite transporter (DMT)-like permease [Paenibacillus sp. PvP091]MBP1171294.1 drug/metabolite transporter (DMT)-like permease [Paenibacillus sp. PvR098]MBP2442322.1 drug/metabolite transporter (DMT)-like permease [Paenibacillus sp. PvP052]
MNVMIVILCLIWGFNWVVMKQANTVFPPVLFAGYRFGLGAAVLLIFYVYKRVPLPDKKDWKWIIACGLLHTTYFNIAIQLALNDMSAGLTSVLTYSMPLWLTVMAHYWIPGERLTLAKTAGVILGIAGLFLTLDVHLGGGYSVFFLALSSGVTWAVSTVIMKRKLVHCDNMQFTTWQMAVGAAGLFLYSFLFEHTESDWGIMPVLYIVFAGVVASAFAFILWYRILSTLEASKASVSLLMVPVVGVLSGVLVLNESLKPATLGGIVCILAGVWLVNSRKGERRRKNRGMNYHTDSDTL